MAGPTSSLQREGPMGSASHVCVTGRALDEAGCSGSVARSDHGQIPSVRGELSFAGFLVAQKDRGRCWPFRGKGNRIDASGALHTPAEAGSTSTPGLPRGHPRGRGDHPVRHGASSHSWDQPRGRGDHGATSVLYGRDEGPPQRARGPPTPSGARTWGPRDHPRRRGDRYRPARAEHVRGIVPAGAGAPNGC